MNFNQLGHSDIHISEICLGTMTWGRQNTQAEAFEQMDYAITQGINFFDTAELYPIPPEAETQGRTETMIGNWFSARGGRDKIILASKVTGRSPMTWFRKNGAPTELTRAQMEEALDESLRRLQTDYIDLYQLHWPDRPINLFGGLGYEHRGDEMNPIEDILSVLDGFVQSGKVRMIGLSNETPWGTMRFLQCAEMQNKTRIVTVQNAYNLLNRVYELGGAEIYHREGIGLLAYSPLAQGYLSGKYLNGAIPKGSRKDIAPRLGRYETPTSEAAICRYMAIADKYGVDVTQMASRFVTTRPFVTANIIGATSMAQLKTAISANQLTLSEDMLADIEEAHLIAPNICP